MKKESFAIVLILSFVLIILNGNWMVLLAKVRVLNIRFREDSVIMIGRVQTNAIVDPFLKIVSDFKKGNDFSSSSSYCVKQSKYKRKVKVDYTWKVEMQLTSECVISLTYKKNYNHDSL